MNRKHIIFVFAVCIAAGACGQKTMLEPATDASLPQTPYGSTVQPEADDLLEPDTLAQPERSIELRTRSEEREDDPFDLPPE